jgi:hypothetical protein
MANRIEVEMTANNAGLKKTIGDDAPKIVKGFTDDAGGYLSKFTEYTKDIFTGIGKDILGAFAVQAVVGKIFEITKAIADYSEGVNNLAGSLGYSNNLVIRFTQSARENGSSFEGARGALEKFAKSVDQLEAGEKSATESFQKFGIAARDLIGLSMDEKFTLVSKAIAEAGDAIGTVSGATEIMGKSFVRTKQAVEDFAKSSDSIKVIDASIGMLTKTVGYLKDVFDKTINGVEKFIDRSLFGYNAMVLGIAAVSQAFGDLGAGRGWTLGKRFDEALVSLAGMNTESKNLRNTEEQLGLLAEQNAEKAAKITFEKIKTRLATDDLLVGDAKILALNTENAELQKVANNLLAEDKVRQEARELIIKNTLEMRKIEKATIDGIMKKEKEAADAAKKAQKEAADAAKKYQKERELDFEKRMELIRLEAKAIAGSITKAELETLETLRLQKQQKEIQADINVLLNKGEENLTQEEKARLLDLINQNKELDDQIKKTKQLAVVVRSMIPNSSQLQNMSESDIQARISQLKDKQNENTQSVWGSSSEGAKASVALGNSYLEAEVKNLQTELASRKEIDRLYSLYGEKGAEMFSGNALYFNELAQRYKTDKTDMEQTNQTLNDINLGLKKIIGPR